MAAFRTEGVAFVTGAGSGIGQGAVYALAEAGASTIICADINEAAAQATAEASKNLATQSSFKVKAVQLDVTKPENVDYAFTQAASEFGRIDYLINSAGVDVNQYVPLPDIDTADFNRVLDVNTRGILHCTRSVVRIMQKQDPLEHKSRQGNTRSLGRGSIVNVTSVLSYAAVTGKVAYITSKHASLGLTKATAQDVSDKQIRVNAICPAWVRTAMFTEESKKFPPVTEVVKAAAPAGRPAEPEEIGESIVYLCSPAASYTNGIGLIVDSGLTLTLHLGI